MKFGRDIPEYQEIIMYYQLHTSKLPSSYYSQASVLSSKRIQRGLTGGSERV